MLLKHKPPRLVNRLTNSLHSCSPVANLKSSVIQSTLKRECWVWSLCGLYCWTRELGVSTHAHPRSQKSLTFFKKIFIYSFLEQGKGKEGERETERETLMCERYINWLPLMPPQLGTWPTTQACTLTGNWTRVTLWFAGQQFTEPHQPGQMKLSIGL